MSKSVSKLFEPLTIRGQVLKNRIGVSPMVTWIADPLDGQANDFHHAHYGQFALGGAGLVVLEATAVEPRGRVTPSDLGIWSDHQVDGLSRIARFLTGQGSLPGIQLAHSGRKGSTSVVSRSSQSLAIGNGGGGWPTIAPSAIPFGAGISQVPIEATVDDLLTIRQSFVLAAVRAVRAGFQLIELHYAHGYLVNQFLSPLTNRRTDHYGGSLDNRMRLGLEIAADVRQAIPDNLILAVRISFTDYVDSGWDLSQSIEFSKQLKQLGVDLLDVSSGGVVSGVDYSAFNTPDRQHRASEAIQREADIRTTAVGKIIDPLLAEKLLQSNCATIVLIGRAFLNDPHWPYTAADKLNGQSFKYPDPYDWCIGWKAMNKWRKDLYSNQNDMSKLFEPLTIRGQVLKNRIGVSPMIIFMADPMDGQANDFHLAHYGQFALGGAGLVVLESTAVEARGRITPSDLGIWSDHQVDGLSRIAKFLTGQGSLPGIQLAHSGRKGSTSVESVSSQSLAIGDGGGWPTIAPSAIPFGAGISQVPTEATVDDLLTIRQSFVLAAVRAVRAGFQLIELHYGHGYLVNQFLSPVTNRRTDHYGGSLDNHMRLGLEIVADVRQAIPDNIILAVRISFTDYADNGWDLRQSIEFSKQLKQLGVDLLDVSSGGVVSGVNYSIINTPDRQHRASEAIQREAGIRTTVVGKIVDPLLAEKLLQTNSATIVLIGRAFLNDPHWPYSAADKLNDNQSFKYPDPYDWCIGWKAMYKWRQDLYTNQNDDNN
ncbi:uncharacterized protein LOC128951609 [Oppia nitens]|uniref:uncharacterized protein LOC128951609 n=1 Tax=Oppia nitens TaxID=1686743 RepID=UPI0023DBE933|nr:uncharacterized protein LOC128951609 [Oppia nitens]